MDFLIYIFENKPFLIFGMLGLFFFFILWVLYISLYIYTNVYLKNICGLIYRDENRYKRLLEILSFHYISMLPSAYWRETLNIKFNLSFKNLYQQNFYQKIDKNQLQEFLKKYPFFFISHYLIILSGVLGTLLLILSYLLSK
ncbi:hypothetical protein [Acinetobacter soli]|uniref:hypothetical protein n=1 Tax=Acinetobacter soli TaxID=487316 RepID=UPI001250370A|nr:hypothetical protein [Acinetobacter soli]MCE6005895.1 hypothetical protein [Acinetobacter soli]